MKYVTRMKFIWTMIVLLLVACTESTPQADHALSGIVYSTRSGLQVFNQGERTELVSAARLGAYDSLVILSPDGRYVAYSRTGQDLWLTDLNTMKPTALISESIRDSDADIRFITWSPDGQQIGIVINSIGPAALPERATLFLFHIQSHKLVKVLSGVIGFAWIPNINSIAVVKRFGEPVGLYLMHGDADPQMLIEGYMEPYIAASPDGRSLSVVLPSSSREARTSLFAINLTDYSVRDLLQGRDLEGILYPMSPTWSPDGGQVAFLACVPLENDSVCASSLMIVDVKTNQVRTLASRIQSPIAWSPSSDSIIGIEQGGAHGIVQVSVADGSTFKVIDDRPANYPFEYR